MLAIVAANLSRRWGRTALTALGVAVGVTTIVALLAVTDGLSRSAGDLAKLGRADFGVFQSGLADLTASSLPAEAIPRVKAVPGVAAASPIQILPHALAADSSILTFGAPPDSFLARRLVIVSGGFMRGDEAMVGSGAAQRLHVAPGGSIVVEGVPLRVAAVYRSGIALEDAGVVVALTVAQRLSNRPGEVSMIAVSISPGYREADVENRIERAIPGTAALGDPSEVARVDTNSRVITKAAVIIAILALALGAVVVVNTMAMAMVERRSEFGVLTAVGWTRAEVVRLILGEAVAVSLAGAAVGMGAGVLASELLIRALTATNFVSPAITPWVLGRGLLVGFALGVVGAVFSVWRVMRVQLVTALQR